MSSSQAPSTAPAAVGYFVDQKKGEVNELKSLLKNLNVERDLKRKREIIKKVIAYMTLGIDVSRLFTEMVMAIETKDIVIKKMVYLYLCNYAHKQPDMAIMCINSLLRDCDNEDPMVRGLALRSLCNLRLNSILDYVDVPLNKCLKDVSSYVRKTAVMSILKLNSLSPGFAEKQDYITHLYRLLEDPDAMVVTNSVMVLNELLLDKGGMEVTQKTVMTLLNRVGEFSEWGLNAILDLVSRYRPRNDDEAFAIMNLLDPVLRTANSGAVLATFKCFLALTTSLPDLHPQIISRAKPPFLTLITGSNYDIQYTMLKHLQVILPRQMAQGLFDDEYRQFFVRYNEPSYVKYLKIGLLPYVANNSNYKDVISELVVYITDVDTEVSKKSIDAMGAIAVRVGTAANDIVQNLLEFIDLDISHVRAQSVKNVCIIVRIFSSVRQQVLPTLAKCLRRVDDAECKAMVIWMIGEYGEEIVESPYLIESIIRNYDEEQALSIKLNLLTASMKLFFKRPPEMHRMLGKLLSMAINDTSTQDIHDKALLYYRLLTANIDVAATLFSNILREFDGVNFAEDRNDKKKDKVFQEFNTLSVIYSSPASYFIEEEFLLKTENAPMPDETFSVPVKVDFTSPVITTAPPTSAQTQAPTDMSVSLLDFDDQPTPAIPFVSTQVSLVAATRLSLVKNSPVTPDAFQQLWGTLPDRHNGTIFTMSKTFPSSINEVESIMLSRSIFTIASGLLTSPMGMKFFFYCSGEFDGESGALFLLQILMFTPGDTTAIVKSNFGSTATDELIAVIVKTLSQSYT